METKKRILLIISLILIGLLNYQGIYASGLGISPAVTKLKFQPGFNFSINFQVFQALPNQSLSVSAGGDFAEYVHFDKTNLTGPEGFTAYVNLPETADKPGKNSLYINVGEVLDPKSGLASRLGIGSLISIRVPYPGKYAEIRSFSVDDVNEGEPVKFYVSVESLGKEAVSVEGNLEIYYNNNTDKFNLGSKYIEPDGTGVFEKILDKNYYKAGTYNATAFVSYEGKVINESRTFKVGNLFVDIINWSSEFNQSRINPFFILIESKWNGDIKNVYAEVNISKDGKEVDFFKTPSIELKKWEKAELKGFFNAENINVGDYKAKIVLIYDDKTSEKTVDIKVVPAAPETNKILIIILIVSVIIIVIFVSLMIITYLSLKRRKKKKK